MPHSTDAWLGGIALALAMTVGAGCGKQTDVPVQGATPVPGSPVLAKVNGEPITEADVELTLQRTFSGVESMMGEQGLRRKVLDSLIASRAMKRAVIAEMSPGEAEQIRQMARAYEEELFVKEYLKRHASPEPVTTEMVKLYYNENPDQFGTETLRDFELLKAPSDLDEAKRDRLLQAVATIRGEADWQKAAKVWEQRYGLQYQKGRSRTGLLHRTLDEALQRLEKGATSEVLYIDGQLHVVRLLDLTRTPPKPLSEVSGDIRKKLAPLQLKKAIKQVSDQARSQAEVELTP